MANELSIVEYYREGRIETDEDRDSTRVHLMMIGSLVRVTCSMLSHLDDDDLVYYYSGTTLGMDHRSRNL